MYGYPNSVFLSAHFAKASKTKNEMYYKSRIKFTEMRWEMALSISANLVLISSASTQKVEAF